MWFSRWFPLQKWTTCPWNIFHLQNNKCFCFCNTFTNVDWISDLKQTIVIGFTFVTKWSHPTCLTRAQSICVVTCLLTIWRARKGTIITIKPIFASWSIYNHVQWSTYKITFKPESISYEKFIHFLLLLHCVPMYPFPQPFGHIPLTWLQAVLFMQWLLHVSLQPVPKYPDEHSMKISSTKFKIIEPEYLKFYCWLKC